MLWWHLSLAEAAQGAMGTIRSRDALLHLRLACCTLGSDSRNPILQVGISQGFLGGLTMGVTNLVAFCAYALAMWYGGKRVADGAYNGGWRGLGAVWAGPYYAVL